MNENEITEKIIGAAMEVHNTLGPGLLESIYERALLHELESRGLKADTQKAIAIDYKGVNVGDVRLDLIIEGIVVVEIKSVERLMPVFTAQLVTYLRASGCKLGLLLNFNTLRLKDGIKRVII